MLDQLIGQTITSNIIHITVDVITCRNVQWNVLQTQIGEWCCFCSKDPAGNARPRCIGDGNPNLLCFIGVVVWNL